MKKLLKQMQDAQAKMMKMQEELAGREVEGSAGGGMIKVKANGRHEVIAVKIDPTVVDPDDIEMLEDLIAAAVNDAQARADELIQTEMSKVTGGLSIPGMM